MAETIKIQPFLVSAAFIPIHLLELGEEIGWREYLLPKHIVRYGSHRTALLNGILWGIAHRIDWLVGIDYAGNYYVFCFGKAKNSVGK